jgi:excinuclease ABC subunit B
VALKDKLNEIILQIEHELRARIYLESEGKYIEAKRIHERTNFDLEMIKSWGIAVELRIIHDFLTVGIQKGLDAFCLLDYFPSDYLMFIDESHATIPQLRVCGVVIEAVRSIW